MKDEDSKEFQHFNLKVIPLTNVQANAVFKAFSVKYLGGSYHSFNSLIRLEPVSNEDRLEWKDASPKRPELVNRQTLLEFLSHLLVGFENLENHQMIVLVEHYFILKSPAGIEQNLSSKNISDWRINKAAYLKEVSRLFQHNL
ncbi:MAG: hypothetical protein O2U61_03960 [Candidatus Bathyarchaeota archaeon]|nr:hypothetical protein [Candidatus Bathyarchaeota archaeon]